MIIVYSNRTRIAYIGKLWAVWRQKQGKSVWLRKKEEPKLFRRSYYTSIIIAIFILIIGLLLLGGIFKR
jgi:hypothetical protein